LTFENLGCGHVASSLNGQIVVSRKTPKVNYQNTKLRYVRKINKERTEKRGRMSLPYV